PLFCDCSLRPSIFFVYCYSPHPPLHSFPTRRSSDLPMLIGVSRKSMVGAVLDKPVEERLQGSVALAVLSAAQGAHIFRVHDVAPTVEALRMTAAVLKHKGDVR